jgi:hypothetical protein
MSRIYEKSSSEKCKSKCNEIISLSLVRMVIIKNQKITNVGKE